ncbi:MAG: dihydroorotase family protein [Sulfolobales archaeon]
MKYDLVIVEGRLVIPGVGIIDGDIAINAGKIAAIGRSIDPKLGERVINANGLLIMPGIIDPHFHIGIYRNARDDALSESRSAVTGGITTLISYFRTGRYYLNTGGPYTKIFPELLKMVDGAFYTDYAFHLGIIMKVHLDEMEILAKEYGVTSFKFWRIYSGTTLRGEYRKGRMEEEFLLSDTPYDLGHLYEIMHRASKLRDYHVRVSIHAEEPELIRIFTERVRGLSAKPLEIYHLARPPESEVIAIAEAMYLAKFTGCPINILHISSSPALSEAVRLKHLLGIDAALEVTLHHLTLTVDIPAQIKAKVNPPIRTKEHVEALWEYVRQGKVDMLGSDSAALTSNMKAGDIWSAEAGFSGAGLFMPLLYTEGFLKRNIPLENLLMLATVNPAKIFGLWPRKGSLNIGADADIIIIDPETEKTVTPEILNSAQDFTPWEGWRLKGWPKYVLVRGQVVMDNGVILDKPVGQYIKRPVQTTKAKSNNTN